MSTISLDWTRRLALGTVQFGMDYGVSDHNARVSTYETKKIVEYARSVGISLIDTAKAYGNSEDVLGSIILESQLTFDVVSKLPPKCSPAKIGQYVEDSLDKFGADKVYGYLAHHFDDFKNTYFSDALIAAKNRGLVEKIGVSVYFPHELEWVLDTDSSIDLVQLPLNVFDQRFLPMIPQLKERNIEVHARSIFLQGLFFLPRDVILRRFPGAYQRYELFRQMCEDNSVSLHSALLNFGMANESIDKVLIGVRSSEQLERNLHSYQDYEACNRLAKEFSELSMEDENIIIPFNWS